MTEINAIYRSSLVPVNRDAARGTRTNQAEDAPDTAPQDKVCLSVSTTKGSHSPCISTFPRLGDFRPKTIELLGYKAIICASMRGHYPGSAVRQTLSIAILGDPFKPGAPFNPQAPQVFVHEDKGEQRLLTAGEEVEAARVLARARQTARGEQRDVLTIMLMVLDMRHPDQAHVPYPLQFSWTDEQGGKYTLSFQGNPLQPRTGSFLLEGHDGQGHRVNETLDIIAALVTLVDGLKHVKLPDQGPERDDVALMKGLMMALTNEL